MHTTPNSTFNRRLQNITHVATYVQEHFRKQSREAQNHNTQINTVNVSTEDKKKISLETRKTFPLKHIYKSWTQLMAVQDKIRFDYLLSVLMLFSHLHTCPKRSFSFRFPPQKYFRNTWIFLDSPCLKAMYFRDTLHRIHDGSYSDLVNSEGCRNEWQCVPCDIMSCDHLLLCFGRY